MTAACLPLFTCLLTAALATAPQPVKTKTFTLGDTVNYNKSWLAIDWTPLQGPLVEGDG